MNKDNKMLLLSVLLLSFISCITGSTVIPTSDSNWYFTEFNWGKGDGYAQAVNPGAYFKVGFTGSSVGLVFDFTGASTSNYSTIKYVIDGAPANNFMLPLPNGQSSIQLASGLSFGNHSLSVYVQNSLQSVDRWNTPECVVRVTGLVLDDGSATQAVALRPKRALIFWDSIGEGVEVLDFPGTDLTHNEATQTWAFALAAALQAEVSMAAFGRLGWTIYGNGNVPPVYTPGNDSLSSWNKIDSKHARDFSSQLDYVIIGHGTNDGGAADDQVEQCAFGWLVAQRAAVSASTSILVVVPFGGFKESALTEAFNLYQQKYNDKNTFLIDLGIPAQEGLTHFVNGGTWMSEDGIHPNVWRDGQLGAMLALAIGRTLNI